MREVTFQGDGFQLPLLQSAVFPPRFRHGFTTRQGGVSAAPFDSLNLGGKWGDRPEAVAENTRRLHAAAGGEVHFATQVHGCDVAPVKAGAARAETAALRADAVMALAPGPAVGVYTADCVPVLLADVATGAVAAVHAGWRGTVAGIVSVALARLAAAGSRMVDVRVAIGPSIGPCCFEVGPEVVDAVEAVAPGARAVGAILEHRPRAHVDLWMLNRLAAEAAGVPPRAIEVAAACTSCDPGGRFFSYRRDHGHTGQLAGFIACAQEPPPSEMP